MKVCWVSLVGRPNVGKSTLLNILIDYDLSIISPISQTTRDKISGVYTDEKYQIIFFDTPGIHKSESIFGQSLNQKAYESIKEADLILFLTPLNQEILTGDLKIIDQIKSIKNKIAVITKTDLIKDKKNLFEKINQLKNLGFEQIIPINNKDIQSISLLMNKIKEYAYDDQKYFDDDFITDKTELFLSKELIRSSAIKYLSDELPHSIVIEITKYDINEKENKRYIEAFIYCKKESQKGIIIGKQGAMIKKIGTFARKLIMEKFNTNAQLNLKVKVDKNWIDNNKSLKKYGY